MQGRHQYQPELFSQIDYEQLIPKGHLLRRVDRVLDLSFLHEMTAPLYSAEKGRPSIDPEVFVRMILLEALYNIDSDRQLCEEVGYNLAYRWFCKLSLKDSVPDHSSITRIRDRLGEETYRKIFLTVVDQCKKAGLVKSEKVMADGSLIQANASLYKMEEKETDKKPDDFDEGTGVGQRESKDGLSSNDLRKNSLVGKKLRNQTHQSITDPDATLAGKHGEYKSLRYKTHHIADFESRVILDCHVTTGTVSETTVFKERLEVVEKDVAIKINEVIADRGYGASYNQEYLINRGIESNIPRWSTRSGETFFEEIKQGFKFDRQTQVAVCPEGHQMRSGYRASAGRTVFTLPKMLCHKCPRAQTCLSEFELRKRGKKFFVPDYIEAFTLIQKKEQEPEFKSKLRQRMWKQEGLFAEAKSHHGLRRARYRGRWKMQMQVYVISTVQNLKRLAGSVFDGFIAICWKIMKIEISEYKFEKSWIAG